MSKMSLINKLIDAFFENDEKADTILHFVNEAIIHKKPDIFVRNFIKYRVLKNERKSKRYKK